MFAYGFIYLLILAVLSFQADDLPPLAVTQYGVDDSLYYVVDVQTGNATPIQRTGPGIPITGVFYGYNIAPIEIPFQSPYDESLKFVLVNDINPSAEADIDYNLYQITGEGKRIRIVDYAWTGEYQYWSSDQRYLYITISEEGSAPLTLHRLELDSGTLSLVAENAGRLNSCDATNTWCVFSNTGPERNIYNLFLLNKNTGEIRTVDELPNQHWTWTFWQSDTPELYYVSPYTDKLTVHSYNYDDQTHTTVVEIPYQFAGEITRSPDRRWLAMSVSDGESTTSEIMLVDLQAEDRKLIPVTRPADTPGTVSQFSLAWAGTRLLYSMRRNDVNGLYSAEPGEAPVKLLDVGDDDLVFDYALLPDGIWLAVLLVDPGSDRRLLIVPVAGGELREILQLSELEEINCIGWMEEAVSMSGEAYLCDKYWGVG